jgi:hypothetical protein
VQIVVEPHIDGVKRLTLGFVDVANSSLDSVTVNDLVPGACGHPGEFLDIYAKLTLFQIYYKLYR